MEKYSIKCARCGAPIQWNNASLNVSCEYCGQPVNQFKKENKFDSLLKKIPLTSNEFVRDKGKFLLSKQKVLSESQLEFIGSNINRFFSNKRYISILIAIPIASWGYMKINYPIKAEPSFPKTPYKPSIPIETGNFVLYANNKSKKEISHKKQWCKEYRSREDLSECIRRNPYQSYFDKGSAIKEGDWVIVKMGSSTNNEVISTEGYWDLAVNCKKGIMAWYTDYPDYFEEYKIERPDSYIFEAKEIAKYEREKPAKIAKKMGRLWWLDNQSYLSDISDGEYMAWNKEKVRTRQKYLSEVGKDCTDDQKKCSALEIRKSKAFWKDSIKRYKADLTYEKIERKKYNYIYTNLFRKVCRIKI